MILLLSTPTDTAPSIVDATATAAVNKALGSYTNQVKYCIGVIGADFTGSPRSHRPCTVWELGFLI